MRACEFVPFRVLLPSLLSVCVGAALLPGCSVGEIFAPSGPRSSSNGIGSEDGDGPGAAGDPAEHAQALKFECDPAVVPSNLPLRRLARAEYTNSLRLL